MNNFKHACFISYRNGHIDTDDNRTNDLMNTFAQKLKKALLSEFTALLEDLGLEDPVFLDQDNLKTGKYLVPEIADALCHSVCMIVVYTPNYFDSKKLFCASEYLAMCKREEYCFEKMKIENSTQSLIFPLLLRANKKNLPEEIKQRAYTATFYDFELTDDIGSKKSYRKKITEIAEKISIICQKIINEKHNLCEICSEFKLPIQTEEGKLRVLQFIDSDKTKYSPIDPFS